MTEITGTALASRVVRYADLKPCYNAFVDSRTPGSDRKENFTIIGPGVSENPEQFVHIAEKHGFNIGGARQPPACVNSQHSHETAEVFVIHSGQWRFDFGVTGSDASFEAGPGDVVSFPPLAFRGFTNIGKNIDQAGFLWAVLGADDPGRVTWAPQVFDLAKAHGLVLLENGSLVDTVRGEAVPDGVRPMPRTTPETVAAMRRISPDEASTFVARDPSTHGPGETLLIGPDAPLAPNSHFTLSQIALDSAHHAGDLSETPTVMFVHHGKATVEVAEDVTTLGPGDTITIPVGARWRCRGTEGTTVFVVRGV
ncbi:cupin domain-containing protein [Novosphingobium sp. Gsoil 351]|uniref:cupin domain-containing protein n=1 Tax=Novosphingobium sp. Gsoil 351 TaxID=2675225 RepID=UPI0012B4B528|nr:cupin domain-containing protein [Novosphingobium sp. Gsoil 351]QGN55809.1 cupin domain-containing protein [Novosphingobium sp. Gsoil 351]